MNLKKFNGSEIKKLFDTGELDLSEYSKDELTAIFEHESEALTRDPEHDTTLLISCADALSILHGDDIAPFFRERSLCDIIDGIAETAHCADDKKEERKKRKEHYMPRRRVVALLAAVLILSALCVGAVAYFNPFSAFGLTPEDISKLPPGTVLDFGYATVEVPIFTEKYDSVDELSAEGYDLLWPTDCSDKSKSSIYFEEYSMYHTISTYFTENGVKTAFSAIFEKEEYSYLYNEDTLKSSKEASVFVIDGRTLYIIPVANSYCGYIFADDVVYAISAPCSSTIKKVAEQLEYLN